MAIRVLPYRQGSRGARALADAAGGRVLRLQGSNWRARRGDVVVNWGNTQPPAFGEARLLNGRGLRTASNKREFFQAVAARGEQDIVPRFWTNRDEIPNDAYPIVCRTVLAGHSGEGIVLADGVDDLVPAPLYVQYVKKSQEFRIHVGRERRPDGDAFPVIAMQRKARNRAIPDDQINWQVRNHQNGFIYAREGVAPPECVLDVAKRALACTELDFGAVDVIYNERSRRAFVLEINTAPGLEGQTVNDYARYFEQV